MRFTHSRFSDADRFTPELLAILRDQYPGEDIRLETAGSDEDQARNTDAWVGSQRVMLRASRGYDSKGRKRDWIHFRAEEWSDELGKIRAGYGDLMLVGWRSSDESRIERWALLDLRVLAGWLEAGNELPLHDDSEHPFWFLPLGLAGSVTREGRNSVISRYG